MKLERSSAAGYVIVMLACLSLLSFGCKKKTPPPVEIASSEAVMMVEEPSGPEAGAQEIVVEEEVVEETVQMIEEPEAPLVAEKTVTVKSTHRVQKGECLWKIAETGEVYDDPFQWPLIYRANMDQIKDPDLIYPDQNLEIPRDSSASDVASARHEAKTRGPWSLWDGK